MNVPMSDMVSILRGDDHVIHKYLFELQAQCPCCKEYFMRMSEKQKYCYHCGNMPFEKRKAKMDSAYSDYRKEQKRLDAQCRYGTITKERLEVLRKAAKDAYLEKMQQTEKP